MVTTTVKLKPVETLISSFQSILSHQKTIVFLQILLASWFVGICSQIEIPLYFTPVPLTFQTTSVMLVGVFLGSRRGVLTILSYLLQGGLGLPVFAGGSTGALHFFGPTGGYLIGFIVQVYVVGLFFEKGQAKSLIKIACALLLSIGLQLGIGTLWLAQFVGANYCLNMGFYPFIPGEILKACLVAGYIKSLKS